MAAPEGNDAQPRNTAVSHSQAFADYSKLNTKEVEQLVSKFPGSTNRELSKFANKSPKRMASRLAEAKASSKRNVHAGRRRVCDVTGNPALTWWDREVPQ